MKKQIKEGEGKALVKLLEAQKRWLCTGYETPKDGCKVKLAVEGATTKE